MAAAPATVAWQVTCPPPTDKRWPLPPLFIKIGVRSFAESFLGSFPGAHIETGIDLKHSAIPSPGAKMAARSDCIRRFLFSDYAVEK
jgi:hypothetical protein